MDVAHVAKLANLPLKPGEEEKFSTQFDETLKTVNLINELDTQNTPPTSQVTGQKNKTRPDVIDKSRVLPVVTALSGAKKTRQNYFVVPNVFNAQ